tara:strand:+ start:197 stop:436 length:240 start_codon:yes stop_codon:yes gene_type:complete
MSTIKDNIKKIIEQVANEEQESNLVLPIDHSEAVGSEPVTNEPEVIDHSTGKVVKMSDRTFSMNEAKLREMIRRIISRN